jgi:serine/threonine protein kinase
MINLEYNEKSDVYSFGSCVYELVFGFRPWMIEGREYEEQKGVEPTIEELFLMIKSQKPKFPDDSKISNPKLYNFLVSVMNDCWELNSDIRISVNELVKKFSKFTF